MTTSFIRFGVEYEVCKITAIAEADEANENARQDALLVSCCVGGETVEEVVFGYELPIKEEEFTLMCGDSAAWESDYEVLATVKAA